MSTNNKTNTPKDTIPSLKARVQEVNAHYGALRYFFKIILI